MVEGGAAHCIHAAPEPQMIEEEEEEQEEKEQQDVITSDLCTHWLQTESIVAFD